MSNGGTIYIRQHCISDAADIPDNKDGKMTWTIWTQIEEAEGGGASKASTRRRATVPGTIMGQISNLGSQRDFLCRIIKPDSPNLDGNNRDPMEIIDDHGNNRGCKHNNTERSTHLTYWFCSFLLGPMIMGCVCG